MTTPRHAALARDDRNNLQVRHFPTAADAARAAAHLEAPLVRDAKQALACLVEPSDRTPARMIDHKTFARRLGVGPKLVRHAFRRGAFPGAVQHSAELVHIPARWLNLAHTWGIHGVERRVKAGILA